MDDQINKSSPEHFVWTMSQSDVYQTDIPSSTNQNDLDRSWIEFSSKQRSDLFPDISKLALFFNWLTRVETLKYYLKNLALRKKIDIKDQDGLIEFPKSLNQAKLLNLLKYFGLIKLSKLCDVHNLYEQLNRHDQNKKIINLQKALVLFERYNLTNLKELFELTSLTIKYGTGTGFLTDTKEIFNFPNLLKLTLTDCKKLTSLEKIGNLTELLPGLTELILTDCHGLKSLVGIEKLANRSNLISLTLKQCYTLESLATSIENLQPHQPNLLKLEILDCLALPLQGAEEVEKIFKLLPQLKDLTINRYNPSTSLKKVKKVKEVKKAMNVINNRPMPNLTKRPNQEEQSGASLEQVLSDREEQLIDLTSTGCSDSISPIEARKEGANAQSVVLPLKLRIKNMKNKQEQLTNLEINEPTARSMSKFTKRPKQEEQSSASLEQMLSDREEQLIDLTSTVCGDSISPIEARKEGANAQSVVLPLKLRIKNMKNKQEQLTNLEINEPTARSMSKFTKRPKQEEQSGASLEQGLSDREEQLIDLTSTGCGDSISPIEVIKEVRKEVARNREVDMKLQLIIEKLKNKQKPTRTTLLLSDLTIEKCSMPKLRPAPTDASLGQALAGWASNRSMPKLTKRPNQDEQSSLSDPPCKRQKECFTNGSHVGATGGLFPLYH